MEKTMTTNDESPVASTNMTARAFEHPSIQEISLCCEISAYAPIDEDRPLF